MDSDHEPDSAEERSALTCREFKLLLARAMEIQCTDSDREARIESFLAAGIELGLKKGPVENAFVEFQERQRRVNSATVVEGSSIKMSLSGNDLMFVAPPAGPKGSLVTEIVAGGALLGVAFLQGWVAKSILPVWALLPIPLGGLGYMVRALYRMVLREEIHLSLEEGSIERSVGKVRWRIPFRPSTLIVRVEEGLMSGSIKLKFEWSKAEQYLLKQTLLSGYGDAEKRWVASAINGWIGPSKVG